MSYLELLLFIAGAVILLAFAWGFTLLDETKSLKKDIELYKVQLNNFIVRIKHLENENETKRATNYELGKTLMKNNRQIADLTQQIYTILNQTSENSGQ